jgi:hypothetical protein
MHHPLPSLTNSPTILLGPAHLKAPGVTKEVPHAAQPPLQRQGDAGRVTIHHPSTTPDSEVRGARPQPASTPQPPVDPTQTAGDLITWPLQLGWSCSMRRTSRRHQGSMAVYAADGTCTHTHTEKGTTSNCISAYAARKLERCPMA